MICYNDTAFSPGNTYYFKAWSVAQDDGWTSSGNTTAPFGDEPKRANATTGYIPKVQTNETTHIEETNTTLHGWLIDNGSIDATCWFLINDTNDFSNPLKNFTMGVVANQSEFENDTAGELTLSKGTLYWVDTKANNSAGWNESGGVLSFLTKPDPPNTFAAQTINSTIIELTWVKGDGANNTYIERNKTGVSVWERGQGDFIYNDTGTFFEDDTCKPGINYCYQAWSYSEWSNPNHHQWSDVNVSDCSKTNNPPTLSNETPTNKSKNLSILLSLINVTINDLDGDSMDWTIETVPNIGSDSNNGEGNGSISAAISGLTSGTNYTWYVNVTDGMDWTNATYWFVANAPPEFSFEVPTNQTKNVSATTTTINLTIKDPNGETFNWTIETVPNVGSNSANDDTNGSKSATVAGLVPGVNYTWYVNATDGIDWTNETYWFVVNRKPVISLEDPTNHTDNVSVDKPTISVLIEDPDGDNFKWTISTVPYVGSSSATGDSNGTKSCSISGLQPGTFYYWYVNVSDGSDWTNATFWFITNNPPTLSNERPYNRSDGNVSITLDIINVTINDLDGDLMTWTIETVENIGSDSNSGEGNGSISASVSGLISGTNYTLFVNVTDGIDWTNVTYWFVTSSNHPPVLSNETPENESTGNILNPTLGIQINDSDGNSMNITWYWGPFDDCPNLIGSNNTLSNGTYYRDNDANFSSAATTYYWKVCVFDGSEWTNATYHFKTAGVNKEIISKEKSAYTLEISPDGQTLIGYVNNTNVTTSIDSNWHYVVLTYDGSTLSLYKDGKLANSTSLSGEIPANDVDLLIGDRMTGTLDELRVSETVRDANWINTSYNMMNQPVQFIDVKDEQTQQYTYLNITFENTGSTNLRLEKFNVLVNGTDTEFIYLQPYVFPEKETKVLVNVSATGAKRNKLITENGIYDCENI